jgi:hypothetical protein
MKKADLRLSYAGVRSFPSPHNADCHCELTPRVCFPSNTAREGLCTNYVRAHSQIVEEYASIRELIASVNTSAFLVTYLVRLPTTGLSGQVRTPHVAGVPVEVQKFGNKTSGNRACDIPVVKPHPIACSLHLTFIKRSHLARSMQLMSPCSLSNERFFCSQS